MTRHKHRNAPGRSVLLVFVGIVGLAVLIALLLRGTDVALFNPKGLIAAEERRLTLLAAAVLIGIAVPTLAILYLFAWKYRETNPNNPVAAHKLPEQPARHGKLFLISIWTFPISVFVVLSLIMWSATHRLEPQKAIAADAAPQTIQVIAMRWKWLFLYPEQRIATVNFVQVPANTPVRFDLTADKAPMSSFWIPHLSGQLYAMTGHVNPLNLIADTPGDYPGSSAEINGAGFAGMKFTARVSSKVAFDEWVQQVQQSEDVLDAAEYEKLLEPSENNPVAYYSNPDAGLYDTVIQKYMGSHNHHEEQE